MPLWMPLVAVVLLSASLVGVVLAWRNRTVDLAAARTAEAAVRADLAIVEAQLAKIRRKLVGTELDAEEKSAEVARQNALMAQLHAEIADLKEKYWEQFSEINHLDNEVIDLKGQLVGARARAKRKEKQSASPEPIHIVKDKIQSVYNFTPVKLQSQTDELS